MLTEGTIVAILATRRAPETRFLPFAKPSQWLALGRLQTALANLRTFSTTPHTDV